jgi:mannosyl-3-phosphoglycerate phosphatase
LPRLWKVIWNHGQRFRVDEDSAENLLRLCAISLNTLFISERKGKMEKRHQAAVVVFTDLDGTLLDRNTYSYTKSLPAIKNLLQRAIPVIFCSSKTRAEQEVHRQELGLFHPFIVEDGGAVFIPKDYFPFKFGYNRAEDGYRIIELGISYHDVRQILEQIRTKQRANFTGFGDMTDQEVADETGLDLQAAKRARQREYAETLKLVGPIDEIKKALNAIKAAGLNYTRGGRFYEVMGPNDKGEAATILIDLYRKKLGHLTTVAIGDSPNDLPMLLAVDIPVLVQKPDGTWEGMEVANLRRIKGVGPEGWAMAVEKIVLGR